MIADAGFQRHYLGHRSQQHAHRIPDCQIWICLNVRSLSMMGNVFAKSTAAQESLGIIRSQYANHRRKTPTAFLMSQAKTKARLKSLSNLRSYIFFREYIAQLTSHEAVQTRICHYCPSGK